MSANLLQNRALRSFLKSDWENAGSGGPQHDVRALDGSWGTSGFGVGSNFRMTFTKEGVYPYVCTWHEPGMRGQVIVVR